VPLRTPTTHNLSHKYLPMSFHPQVAEFNPHLHTIFLQPVLYKYQYILQTTFPLTIQELLCNMELVTFKIMGGGRSLLLHTQVIYSLKT